MKRRPRRAAFTLLEILLALGISVLLMGALYVSVEAQLNYAQAGRERVDEAVLARSLLQRIRADLSCTLTPISATQSSSSSGSTSTTTTSTTGTSGTSTSTTDTSTTTSLNAVTPFNGGIMGDMETLTMFVARVPGATRVGGETDSADGGADIHRVTYWLVPDKGLGYQDIARVTADDEATQLPPDLPDDAAAIIAPEVVSLEFHYFDGSNWTDSWDGTMPGDDGVTPLGPPRAVKVIIGVKAPNGKIRNFVHVIAIQAANAPPSTTEVAP